MGSRKQAVGWVVVVMGMVVIIDLVTFEQRVTIMCRTDQGPVPSHVEPTVVPFTHGPILVLSTPACTVHENISSSGSLPNPWQDPVGAARDSGVAAHFCHGTVSERHWTANGGGNGKSRHWDLIHTISTRNDCIEWNGYSPTRHVLQHQPPLDLRQHVQTHTDFWKRTSAMDLTNETQAEAFLATQLELNRLHFVLNPHLAARVQLNHVPIVMMIHKRTEPLRTVLKALCTDVHAISETKMIVSIDGTEFEPLLNVMLEELTYTHVVWHPFLMDVRKWKLSSNYIGTAHVVYVLYLAIHQLNYSYAILLEDDLLPGPDYYLCHASLWPKTLEDKNITSISAYSHGPKHDCHYLQNKMLHYTHNATCMANSPHQLLLDSYFVGWGSGIPRHTFYDLMHVWHYEPISWDQLLMEILIYRNGYSIVPCMPRVRYLPNTGLHGSGGARWEFGLKQDMLVFNVRPPDREYCILV